MSRTRIENAEIGWTKSDGGVREIVDDPSRMIQRLFDAEQYLTTRLRRKIRNAPGRFRWFTIGYLTATVIAVLVLSA